MPSRRHDVDAVLLDAGGVLVLPDRHMVAAAYASVGVPIDPVRVPRAHYVAARHLDLYGGEDPAAYAMAFATELGVPGPQLAAAVEAHVELFTSTDPNRILWSEVVEGTKAGFAALARRGVSVIIVSNSDGRAAINLAHAGVCQEGPGAGAAVVAVIDSHIVGSAKPDRRIFEVALRRVGVSSTRALHVGDMLSTDVAGARGAGVTPIHFDPMKLCPDRDHSHARTLSGVAARLRRGGALLS